MFWHRKSSLSPSPDYLPVLSGNVLLDQHCEQVRTIRGLCSVPDAHWQAFYLAPLHGFAAYVQQLPASESHHHSGAGGLLTHTLEVIAHGLRLRKGHLLPQGADAEALCEKQDLWSYAIFSATLLHDVAKPLTDQIITLYSHDGSDHPWQGLVPMPEGGWYRTRFRARKHYRLHEAASPLLASTILPSCALAWLCADHTVMSPWLAYISGRLEEAGILGEICQQADALSVANNLGASNAAPLAATRTSLHEKLLTALRYLIKEGKIPINRSGAAAWFDGETLWLVSKRGIDAIREHLISEGHSGIPSRNDRIFDELQQHGITLSNGDKSIRKATVTGDGWSHTLTFLCIPASRLWPEQHTRPEAFAGAITPEQSGAMNGGEESGSSPDSVTDVIEAPSSSPTTLPPQLSELESTHTEVVSFTKTDSMVDEEEADPGQLFLHWLIKGLQDSRFELNSAAARIHRVSEGLLLVSPGIFKDYGGGEWQHAQKRFQKLKLHRKTSAGTNIYTYQVTGGRNRSRVKGFLIELPCEQLGGIVLPDANPHLSLLES